MQSIQKCFVNLFAIWLLNCLLSHENWLINCFGILKMWPWGYSDNDISTQNFPEIDIQGILFREKSLFESAMSVSSWNVISVSPSPIISISPHKKIWKFQVRRTGCVSILLFEYQNVRSLKWSRSSALRRNISSWRTSYYYIQIYTIYKFVSYW